MFEDISLPQRRTPGIVLVAQWTKRKEAYAMFPLTELRLRPIHACGI